MISLFVADIILQEFRNIFLKEYLRKVVSAAFLQVKIKAFDFKS